MRVCVCVRLCVCGRAAVKTDRSILIKLSTNDLTDICEVRFSGWGQQTHRPDCPGQVIIMVGQVPELSRMPDRAGIKISVGQVKRCV